MSSLLRNSTLETVFRYRFLNCVVNFATTVCSLVKGCQTGGFQTGGFPDLDLSFLFVPFLSSFGTFPIFLGFSRFARGWSRDFPDSSLFSFSAYQEHLRGTVPKGSATQSGPFPKTVGNPPVWKPPGLASLFFGLFSVFDLKPSFQEKLPQSSW